jgi:hypothetical protein
MPGNNQYTHLPDDPPPLSNNQIHIMNERIRILERDLRISNDKINKSLTTMKTVTIINFGINFATVILCRMIMKK